MTKTILLSALALSALAIGIVLRTQPNASAAPTPPVVSAWSIPISTDPGGTALVAVAPLATPTAPPASELPDPIKARLSLYTLGVMQRWAHAGPAVTAVGCSAVAESIAMAVVRPDDAVLLAALAYFEGARFAEYVDDGLCNDKAWRKTPEGIRLMHIGGDCDHGHAHSLWQIHPIEDPASPIYGLCSLETISLSRAAAAGCALEIAKRSLRETGSLMNYTGEWAGPHPKADERLKFARDASAQHPFH